jgi:Tfp pilus assembly protein PilO
MPDLGNSRRKLKIAIGAMLAADVVAVAVLFSPLVGSADSRQLQLNLLRVELTKKTREVEPLRGMDKKIVLAKEQIGAFYKDRFAAKDSDLLDELGKLAPANGVRMQQAKYKEEDAESSGIIPVEIQGSFSGDYLHLVRFINALERSKVFFAVDSVDLAGESAGPVKLEITIHSYLYLRSGV